MRWLRLVFESGTQEGLGITGQQEVEVAVGSGDGVVQKLRWSSMGVDGGRWNRFVRFIRFIRFARKIRLILAIPVAPHRQSRQSRQFR